MSVYEYCKDLLSQCATWSYLQSVCVSVYMCVSVCLSQSVEVIQGCVLLKKQRTRAEGLYYSFCVPRDFFLICA